MHRIACLLIALVATGAARAQPHRLTTGVLPVGARVVQVSKTERAMHAERSIDPAPLDVITSTRDSVEWRVVQTGTVGADDIAETYLGGSVHLRAQMAGEAPEERVNDTGSLSPGTQTHTVRDGLQWVYDFPQSPEPIRGEAISAAWERRLARVGESWSLPADTLAGMFGPLADTSYFHVTLDSVGTQDGGPVAFLSYAFDVTTAPEAGSRERHVQSGTVARRIDLGLDVRMEHRSEQTSTFERPNGYRAQTHTTSHTVLRRSVVKTVPR